MGLLLDADSECAKGNAMTGDEYKLRVLQSADDAGRLHPPRLTNWFLMQSMLVEMEIHDRTIKSTSARDEPIRYAITDKGRRAAKSQGAI